MQLKQPPGITPGLEPHHEEVKKHHPMTALLASPDSPSRGHRLSDPPVHWLFTVLIASHSTVFRRAKAGVTPMNPLR